MLYQDITELIGNTPLLRLDPARHGLKGVELYAKLEFYNPFGSVKDRIAWGMIRDDLAEIVRHGQTLIEASSGNTAKALQVLAAMHGVSLRVLTNRTKVPEVRDVLELLGGELEELPGLSECPDPTVPNDVFSTIERIMAENPGVFHHTSQYTNQSNVQTHYETTGKEISDDIGSVDYLFGGLGTTGSTRGTATYLLQHNPHLQTIGVVSTRDDFIPGIRSEAELWDVGLFQPEFYAAIMAVSSRDAITSTLDLARSYGVLAGPTSGATYWAAVNHLGQNPPRAGTTVKVVVLVCDRLEPYLSYFRQRRPDLFGRTRPLAPAQVVNRDRAGAADRPAPEVSVAELAALSADPGVLLIDTRGGMAYRIGHVPGAINIRDDHLEEMLRQGVPFPASRKVVLICPIGEYAQGIAVRLTQAGLDAAALSGGVVAWRDAGMPMETGGGRPGLPST